MTKQTANKRIKAKLGDRAYAYMFKGSCLVWLRNSDRALDPRFEGPLMAAKGASYAEVVQKVESGDIYENARVALANLGTR